MRRVAALAGAMVVALGLAACNDAQAEPEPDPWEGVEVNPDPDAQPEPEPEPTEDEPGPQDYEHPEPGPDIDDDGQAGAEAAAVYFIELYSYIRATGDFDAWDGLSDADCDFCAVAREQVEEVVESDGSIETEPPTIHNVVSEVWASTPGDYVVELLFTSPGSDVYGDGGDLVDSFPPGEVQALVLVVHDGTAWQVLSTAAEDVS